MLIGSIPDDDRTEATNKTFEAEPRLSSLLGMQWIVDNNTLEVCYDADKKIAQKLSQGVVFLFVASVFDPLGTFATFTMRMRIVLKSMWVKSVQQRDNKNDDEDRKQFPVWVQEISELKNMDLMRLEIAFHFFSDASLESLCVVAYLRGEDDDGMEMSFVIENYRIAPKRQQTFWKLEFQAALYSVRLRQLIIQDHLVQIQAVTHWTN